MDHFRKLNRYNLFHSSKPAEDSVHTLLLTFHSAINPQHLRLLTARSTLALFPTSSVICPNIHDKKILLLFEFHLYLTYHLLPLQVKAIYISTSMEGFLVQSEYNAIVKILKYRTFLKVIYFHSFVWEGL